MGKIKPDPLRVDERQKGLLEAAVAFVIANCDDLSNKQRKDLEEVVLGDDERDALNEMRWKLSR